MRFFVIMLLPLLIFAQPLSRKDVIRGTALSAGTTLLTLTEAGLVSEENLESNNLPWWIYATMATQHVPLYKYDRALAFRFSLVEGVTFAAQRASLGHKTVNDIALNYYLKTSFYSTYAIYATLRSQTGAGEYTGEWRSHSATDLALAPFKWKNLSRKEFVRPFLLIGAVSWLTTDKASPIWESSRAKIDGRSFSTNRAILINTSANMILMSATAVAEEALFRGVVYEELKQSLGLRKARIVDALLFPVIHLPQEIAAGIEGGDMLVNFVFRSVLTMLLDRSYDAGGLPLSTTLHFWNNTLSRTLRWAGESGAPDMDIESWKRSGQAVSLHFQINF